MIEDRARHSLRWRAIAAWDEAKRLRDESTVLHLYVEQVRRDIKKRRSRSSAQDWNDIELEALVDHAINHPSLGFDDVAGGTGLAAARQPGLMRLNELMGGRVSVSHLAHDAGTALGLAIATQPDIAIVDANLDGAAGWTVVMAMHYFAPLTKSLLLTDDEESAATVRRAGIDVRSREASDETLMAWIRTSAA